MKTASRILGTAFFLEGFEVQDAPRYGAERRGAPIFAYVRADRAPIHERGIIRRPDLVIVADDTLVLIPAAGVLQGLSPHTRLLIYTRETAATWENRLNLPGQILTLSAIEESEDRLMLRTVGASCAGAAARLLGVISETVVLQAIEEELSQLGSEVVAANREKATEAYALMHEHEGTVIEGKPIRATDYSTPSWVDLPFETADVSAPAIHAPLTSVQVRTGLWRTMRPIIDYGHCNRCWWVCSSLCPDSAISLDEAGYPQIDYDHCKGCMICVAQCPPHAIEAIPEHEAQRAEESS
jgi:pyruvate ferredoxin oxidoreductase gamma subunit